MAASPVHGTNGGRESNGAAFPVCGLRASEMGRGGRAVATVKRLMGSPAE